MKNILGILVVLFTWSAIADTSDEWRFRVKLDGKDIGYHHYQIDNIGVSQMIRSEARFDVKVLFITAFSYEHENSEKWMNNCLTSIDAKTNSNGKRQDVSGRLISDQLQLNSRRGVSVYDDCVQTFAYWNPSILQARTLLNPQTGDHVEIEVTPLGPDMFKTDQQEVEARKFRIRSKQSYDGNPVDITLWYTTDNMRWLGLESPAKGNRMLRYEPVAMPETVQPIPAQQNQEVSI